MATTTIVGTRAEIRSRVTAIVAYLAAGAFVVAALWYGLIARHVSVSAPPVPGASIEATQHAYYAWFVTTLQQERLDTGIAIGAFCCLIGTAVGVRDLLGLDRPLVRLGGMALVLGAVVWIVGNVLQLGGHRAVGLMATHDNPIQSVNAIAFTIDMIDDAFELTAFALIGIGLLAFGWGGLRDRRVPAGWAWVSVAAGVVTIALSGAYLADAGDLVDLLLIVGGVILLPIWLVWSGRLAAGDSDPWRR
jgi:hypothetical protein